ncbi:MAG: hypothetical protein K2X98_01195, partial [Alphaproteobacteria bacterium]|nr:hypothetical protein [Alphaproteobacteria bacterium]
MLGHLSISMKIKMIFCVSLIPVIFLFYLFANEKMSVVAFADKEKVGNELIQKLTPVFDTILKMHGVLAFEKKADEQKVEVEKFHKNGQIVVSDFFETGKTLSIPTIQEKWLNTHKTLEKAFDKPSLSLTTEAIQSISGLMGIIGNESGLVLDPDLDSFYVMDTTVVQIPNILEALSKIMALHGQVTSEAQKERVLATGRLISALENSEKNYDFATKNNPSGSVEVSLKEAVGQTAKILKSFIDAREKNLPLTQDNYGEAILKTLDYWKKIDIKIQTHLANSNKKT